MKKIFGLFLGVFLLSLLVLTGCSAANPAVQAQGTGVTYSAQTTGIWVTGQGKVTVTPDIAILTLGVQAQATTVADAQNQAATAMNAVLAELKNRGVDQKDIQTQRFNISQTYRYDNNTGQQIVTGYQVTNMVTVKIRALDNAGPIIDAVAKAGGNNTRINGFSFTVEDPTRYYTQARQLAVNDAKSRAQNLADLSGVKLGKATYINESTSTSTPQPISAAIAAPAAPQPTTPISAGTTDILLYVQMAFGIE